MMLWRPTRSLLLCLVALGISGIASAGSVSIVPGGQVYYGASEVITVDVILDSIPDHVSAFSLHIQWTPGLSLVSVTSPGMGTTLPGIIWHGLPGHGEVDATGLLLAMEDWVDPPAGGGVFDTYTDISLATLQFHAQVDRGYLGFIYPVFEGGSDGITYWDGAQEVLTQDYALNSGEVVSYLPEPNGALVLGLGVIALACSRRRR